MGRGLKFPDVVDGSLGIVNIESGSAKLESNMKLALSIDKGEFMFRPELGVNIKKYLFAPNDEIFSDLIEVEIRKSLEEQFPVKILEVVSSREDNTAFISITYSLQGNINEFNVEVS